MNLTIVVLTSNSQDVIEGCLRSIKSLGKILIIDDLSTDKTLTLAKKYKTQIIIKKLEAFAKQRNFAIKKVDSDWILFLDSDERLGKDLRNEIKKAIKSSEYSAYKIKRLNYFFGKPITHTGYWPDWQTRLFKTKDIIKFSGQVHETPHFNGSLGTLKSHFTHFTHKSLLEGLHKSVKWTEIEANQFIKANHPPVKWWHLIKVMVKEFLSRYIKNKGFLDGHIGFVESLIQAINKFFIYQQIWEQQQHPSIKDQYNQLDKTFK
jgi:glycosyltransferase involved in cell wall biosynthesis